MTERDAAGAGRWRAAATLAALAVVLCLAGSIWAARDRPMHYDENEYLHASWLMAAGKTLYRDFFEDHPPHLYVLLNAVRPEAPGGDLESIDVRLWTIRARLLSGALGFACVALVALLAWRITRDPVAPLVASGILLASKQMWARAFNDIRAEAPTLALFWAGVVLLSWSSELRRSQALRAGIGIGLMFLAEIWNPKWPLEGAVAGVFFLHYVWRLWRARLRGAVIAALAPAALLAAIAFAPIVLVTTFGDYLFFNFRLKASVAKTFTKLPWTVEYFTHNSMWQTTDPHFRWWWLVASLAIVIVALATKWWVPHDRRLAWVAVALHVSALLELRFIYPYPYLWAQYMVMVATSAAVVYALLPRTLAAIAVRLRGRAAFRSASVDVLVWLVVMATLGIAWSAYAGMTMFFARDWSVVHHTDVGVTWWLALLSALLFWIPFVTVVVMGARQTDGVAMITPLLRVTALAAAAAMAILPLGEIAGAGARGPKAWSAYWDRIAKMQQRLAPGETVWISPPLHPVAAFDASYYWYSFPEAAPTAVRYGRVHRESPLPPVDFEDLPLCRSDGKLRFVEITPTLTYLGGACRCAEQAYRRELIRPTEYFALFEANADPAKPVDPRGAAWVAQTTWLWPQLCRYNQVSVREPTFTLLTARRLQYAPRAKMPDEP